MGIDVKHLVLHYLVADTPPLALAERRKASLGALLGLLAAQYRRVALAAA